MTKLSNSDRTYTH